MPSFPVATHTPILKMHAGPAEPQSSSDQAPVAMSGTRRTVILPFLTSPTTFAFWVENAIELPTGMLNASDGALTPASLGAAGWPPLLPRSVHGVQWSTTFRL